MTVNPKTRMREIPPDKRILSFREVNLGYSEEEAQREAGRCLQCKRPLCRDGCPVKIDIKGFIRHIHKKEYNQAHSLIKESNMLPAICGRVCPQEEQCEKACILSNKNEAIAIGYLERFAANHAVKDYQEQTVHADEDPAGSTFSQKRVAIIGSGPSGLTCASDLVQTGIQVTVYEALHEAGGVLLYGIPQFRLPKEIVKEEIAAIRRLGVDIRLNTVIGRLITLAELETDYDAIFISNGAGLPRFPNLLGEELVNVFSANEFLVRINLMKAYEDHTMTPIKRMKRVVVMGGGNVAVDAARAARRLGGEVSIIYRRTRAEMPAREEEILHALDEGIKIIELANPIEVIGDKRVEKIKCIRIELGSTDQSGRRRPTPLEGSEFEIAADEFIIAIGQRPNPLLNPFLDEVGIKTTDRGTIIVNDAMQTSHEKFFSGGDIIGGNATVIKAMADGRQAAVGIRTFLGNSPEE